MAPSASKPNQRGGGVQTHYSTTTVQETRPLSLQEALAFGPEATLSLLEERALSAGRAEAHFWSGLVTCDDIWACHRVEVVPSQGRFVYFITDSWGNPTAVERERALRFIEQWVERPWDERGCRCVLCTVVYKEAQ